MVRSQTFSLTQLAALTGTGKAGLRAMIDAGQLTATRSDSGRREWTVRREDVAAAGLQLPSDGDLAAGTVNRNSLNSIGVDAALSDLLTRLLVPIEARLIEIESQSTKISRAIADIVDRQGSRQPKWRQVLSQLGRQLRQTVRSRVFARH